jgi:hypothetical protein
MPSKKLAGTILGLLILQFLLGMLANLYAEIPANNPEEVFRQFGYIMFHVLNGVLLVILGAVFLYQALKRHAFKREAIGGLVALVVAFACGEVFVFTQNDIWSLLMALAFIGALMSYARVVFTEFSMSVKKS